MLVTVVHNPGAGYAKAAEDELLDELRRAGYEPVYVSLREAGWRSALAGPVEFVVAAGGDGTVKRVALELAGRDVPVAVVPMGTANNIARTLGVSGSVREQIAWWGRRRIRLLDLGRVSGAGRSDRFLESFGLGAFARAIERLKSREDEAKERFDDAREQLRRDVAVFEEIVAQQPTRRWRMEADGRDFSGDYVLVELMNVRGIGPGLRSRPARIRGTGGWTS